MQTDMRILGMRVHDYHIQDSLKFVQNPTFQTKFKIQGNCRMWKVFHISRLSRNLTLYGKIGIEGLNQNDRFKITVIIKGNCLWRGRFRESNGEGFSRTQ